LGCGWTQIWSFVCAGGLLLPTRVDRSCLMSVRSEVKCYLYRLWRARTTSAVVQMTATRAPSTAIPTPKKTPTADSGLPVRFVGEFAYTATAAPAPTTTSPAVTIVTSSALTKGKRRRCVTAPSMPSLSHRPIMPETSALAADRNCQFCYSAARGGPSVRADQYPGAKGASRSGRSLIGPVTAPEDCQLSGQVVGIVSHGAFGADQARHTGYWSKLPRWPQRIAYQARI
jgi:hypothetical protein